MSLAIEVLHGSQALPFLDALGDLRMAVFREYPYLYDGTVAYETQYLKSYTASERAVVVVARDGARIVGASTAVPLVDHIEQEMVPVLAAAGLDVGAIYYFGESVLRAEYRRLGIGHAFFDQREAAARRYGFRLAAFCAVDRGPDHPARPAGYVPHDVFWQKRGYSQRRDIVAQFSWCDLGEREETAKPMVFWLKELA